MAAAAFHAAGLIRWTAQLRFKAAGRPWRTSRCLRCAGGFSYGDVLGAGQGWAKALRFDDRARAELETHFAQADRLTLGVCNGCQMLSALAPSSPGRGLAALSAEPLRAVRGAPVPGGGAGQPFAVPGGYGGLRCSPWPWPTGRGGQALPTSRRRRRFRPKAIALRYVDGDGQAATLYPSNPNGSELSTAGVCSADGRTLIMMPHPERVFLTRQLSWAPRAWPEPSPGCVCSRTPGRP